MKWWREKIRNLFWVDSQTVLTTVNGQQEQKQKAISHSYELITCGFVCLFVFRKCLFSHLYNLLFYIYVSLHCHIFHNIIVPLCQSVVLLPSTNASWHSSSFLLFNFIRIFLVVLVLLLKVVPAALRVLLQSFSVTSHLLRTFRQATLNNGMS